MLQDSEKISNLWSLLRCSVSDWGVLLSECPLINQASSRIVYFYNSNNFIFAVTVSADTIMLLCCAPKLRGRSVFVSSVEQEKTTTTKQKALTVTDRKQHVVMRKQGFHFFLSFDAGWSEMTQQFLSRLRDKGSIRSDQYGNEGGESHVYWTELNRGVMNSSVKWRSNFSEWICEV